ncbi:MAG: hypothetical protein ACYTX0_20770 [Nostoc sp.]
MKKTNKVFIPTREYPLTLRYHRPRLLISLCDGFARWSIRHSPVFISSPPYRVGERLLLFTAVFMYLNHICRRGTALLCPYRVVYLPDK